jgi:hypothetical protein
MSQNMIEASQLFDSAGTAKAPHIRGTSVHISTSSNWFSFRTSEGDGILIYNGGKQSDAKVTLFLLMYIKRRDIKKIENQLE